MSWISAHVRDPELRDAYAEVEDLASWSPWMPFDDAVQHSPREPGVYLFRDTRTCAIIYAGHAGERAGSGRAQGIYGRLSVYRSGKAAVSGFGEAALDRALADPEWVETQLRHLRDDGPRRAKEWAAAAVRRSSPEISWAVRPEKADAQMLEAAVLLILRPQGVWNS